jgi:exosortase
MGALGVLAMLDAWKDIYLIAKNDEEYSHIFLVPVVALYLVWVRRMRLRHCKPSFRLIGPIIAGIGWGIGSFGFYRGIQSFWHGGAVLVVLGCGLSVLGKNVVFRFLPAIIVLVFLVPVPVRLRLAVAGPLQQYTAIVTQKALEVCGVMNSEVQGNGLVVNDKAVTIAEACNGVRMVFALVLICFSFGFGMPLRNSVRFVILLLSPVATILCNMVRVLLTVLVYGFCKEQVFVKFHDWSGWAMLPLSFLLLYGIIRLLEWAMIPVKQYTLASQGAT